MILFPNFKETLLNFSAELDQNPRILPCPLLFGIDFKSLANEKRLDGFLIGIGFSLASDNLWKRDDEMYEPHFSSSLKGYITLGELNDWSKFLMQRCVDQNVFLYLPLAEELVSYDVEPIKTAIKNLMSSPAGLRMVFNPLSQPKNQAALYTALNILTWPEIWLILFEDYYFRGNLSPEMINTYLQVIENEFVLSDVAEIIQKLSLKHKSDINTNEFSTKKNALQELEKLLKKIYFQ